MTAAPVAFDAVLAAVLLAVAGGAIFVRNLFAAIVLFIVFGLMVAIAWVRLGAVDVALAEAALGAGLTGVLLLGAAGRLAAAPRVPPGPRTLRIAKGAFAAAVAVALVAAVLALPHPGPSLADAALAELETAGVGNPVTAVLLNYRAYDTLLETVVLLVALVALWSLTADGLWGGRVGPRQTVSRHGTLASFGRVLPPVGLLVGLYLVWAGTTEPGGAFQAGTVLAAVWLLMAMAGLAEAPSQDAVLPRLVVAAGPAAFLAAGVAGIAAGAFLTVPAPVATPVIVAIELILTLSIAATLALLVAGVPRRPA